MHSMKLLGFLLVFFSWGLHGAVVQKKEVTEIESQGLYSKNDKVVILGASNFENAIYDKPHAWIVQFYNSYCGHCRNFAPVFKEFAADIQNWKKVVSIAVVDCFVEENTHLCRDFIVKEYPSVRYLHENYSKGNANIGEKLNVNSSKEQLLTNILTKLQDEQSNGRLLNVPSLHQNNYDTITEALSDVPNDIKYTFLIFERLNSEVGIEVILDTINYVGIAVKSVNSASNLLQDERVNRSPALFAIRMNLETTPLTPKNPNRTSLVHAINVFMKSKNMPVPDRNPEVIENFDNGNINVDIETDDKRDVVYFSDIETALKVTLHNEITLPQETKGESLQALLNYLTILIDYYPSRANMREYLVDLRGSIASRSQLSGSELYELVTNLEKSHAPVYTTGLDYVACKGSKPQYRGYTCGLWTLFHTLTVSAANKRSGNAPDVLKAMHGYVKHFFGCTECSHHFQDLASKNKIYDVKDNDKAVLWLWIAHNEVNLRIAGDMTEDPRHPKIQYPSLDNCQECRIAGGTWSLSHVYRYLCSVYLNVRSEQQAISSPLSSLDFGLLSLLYLLSFAILLVLIKLFWAKRFYRKKIYKHNGRDKV